VIGTRNDGLYYTNDGGSSWIQNDLPGFYEQKTTQDSEKHLDTRIATAFNPRVKPRRDVSAIVFDPIVEDTFYIGCDLKPRAGFGVAKITNAGRSWERLPLAGLTHRNTFDVDIDSDGKVLYAGTFEGTFSLILRR
jgi:hypothetical protein